ncbi:hypothetical protein [Paenarthrobacter sp. PH39-S1]|uniref:hypothetical protein n=1 Tax=Paenarthrobacter sp. PH39-S1 TaxID=3046204 RepID=UPI0024BBBD1D|nr:hypothetical protein [Paenarthrobacter sp. PH39-S1]MDJ0356459.1 hypothetical protein [Paenarthrobacter sp. PH39-S1]
MSAPLDTGSEPAEPTTRSVTATALGSWPGTDPVEAALITLGELGDPHLPYLVQLPDRGIGSDAVGRTAAVLIELPVDVQPFGWRLVDRPGADQRRAVSALSTDINVLADVVGAEEQPGHELKIQLCGPWTMAASLYTHYGERALLDVGARREITESLAAGIAEHLARVRSAVPGAQLTLQLDEPEIARVLAGTIPTASGYRTLRSIAAPEVSQGWELVFAAAKAAGAGQVVLALPGADAPIGAAFTAGADGVALALGALAAGDWEQLAGAVENGKQVWAGVIASADHAAELPQVSRLVERVMRPWRGVGLPARQLSALRLTPAAGLAGHTPSSARAVLTRLTDAARALNDVRTE